MAKIINTTIILLLICQLLTGCFVQVKNGRMRVEGPTDSTGSTDDNGGDDEDNWESGKIILPKTFSIQCTSTAYNPRCDTEASMCTDGDASTNRVLTAAGATVLIKWKIGKCTDKSSTTVAYASAGPVTASGYVIGITSEANVTYLSLYGNKLPHGDYCQYILLDNDNDGIPDHSPAEPIYVVDKSYTAPDAETESAICTADPSDSSWKDVTLEAVSIWRD